MMRDRSTILLSLHPEYWDAILAGTKRHEYRSRWNLGIRRVIVYLTRPVGRVVGEFWAGSVGRQDGVYVITILDPIAYDPDRPLSDYGLTRAPQSWCYAPDPPDPKIFHDDVECPTCRESMWISGRPKGLGFAWGWVCTRCGRKLSEEEYPGRVSSFPVREIARQLCSRPDEPGGTNQPNPWGTDELTAGQGDCGR